MVNDRDVVSRDVNVEFDSVHPDVERPLKSRNRIFGRLAVRASMGDDLDACLPWTALPHNQNWGQSRFMGIRTLTLSLNDSDPNFQCGNLG